MYYTFSSKQASFCCCCLVVHRGTGLYIMIEKTQHLCGNIFRTCFKQFKLKVSNIQEIYCGFNFGQHYVIIEYYQISTLDEK